MDIQLPNTWHCSFTSLFMSSFRLLLLIDCDTLLHSKSTWLRTGKLHVEVLKIHTKETFNLESFATVSEVAILTCHLIVTLAQHTKVMLWGFPLQSKPP